MKYIAPSYTFTERVLDAIPPLATGAIAGILSYETQKHFGLPPGFLYGVPAAVGAATAVLTSKVMKSFDQQREMECYTTLRPEYASMIAGRGDFKPNKEAMSRQIKHQNMMTYSLAALGTMAGMYLNRLFQLPEGLDLFVPLAAAAPPGLLGTMLDETKHKLEIQRHMHDILVGKFGIDEEVVKLYLP